jgi:hypothetical protein
MPRLFGTNSLKECVMWCTDPLLGNDSINNPTTNMQPTVVDSFICNVHNTHKYTHTTTEPVFLCWPWSNLRLDNETPKITDSSVESQNGSCGVSSWKKLTVCQQFVNCCNQLYKGPINSITKSKTRLISQTNPRYMTIQLKTLQNHAEDKPVPSLRMSFILFPVEPFFITATWRAGIQCWATAVMTPDRTAQYWT